MKDIQYDIGGGEYDIGGEVSQSVSPPVSTRELGQNGSEGRRLAVGSV